MACLLILLQVFANYPDGATATAFTDSASLGAALRAAHGYLCSKRGSFVPIASMYMDKLEKTSLNSKLAVTAGDQQLVSKYAVMMKKRMEIENRLVEKLGRR